MKLESFLPAASSACAAIVLLAQGPSAQESLSTGTASSTSTTAAATAQAATRLRLPQPGEMNVLMIVLDDLGTDQLTIYADDAGPPAFCAATQLSIVRTPGLDTLRSDGVLYTRCYVEPTCSPTRASLMTGRYTSRYGVGLHLEPGDTHALDNATEVCLPELLDAINPAGYVCGAFGKWHMGLAGVECHPIEAGFDKFEGHLENPDDHFNWRKVTADKVGVLCTSSYVDLPVVDAAPDESFWTGGVTRIDAATWINAQTSPFFAYVAFSPPHAPQNVPPYATLSALTCARLANAGLDAGDEPDPDDLPTARLIHRAMIEGIDYEITQLLNDVSGVLANTMVIIVGDNGTQGPMLDNPAYIGHGKRTLFELGTRAPMLILGPLVPVAAQGGTCRNLVNAVDMWRTVANITGVSNAAIDTYMGVTQIDSVSFFRSIQQPSSSTVRTYAHADQFPNQVPPVLNISRQRGVTNGTYRYMRYYNGLGVMTEYLYPFSDPCETTELLHDGDGESPADSAIANPLRAAMNAL